MRSCLPVCRALVHLSFVSEAAGYSRTAFNGIESGKGAERSRQPQVMAPNRQLDVWTLIGGGASAYGTKRTWMGGQSMSALPQFQTSICSATASASSTSIPRQRTGAQKAGTN